MLSLDRVLFELDISVFLKKKKKKRFPFFGFLSFFFVLQLGEEGSGLSQ